MITLRAIALVAAAATSISPSFALDKSVPAIKADAASLPLIPAQSGNPVDGSGVHIGQIEGGNPLVTHAALNGHATLRNDPANPGPFTDDHATSVAGVMVSQGGAGADTAKKGVAPGAQLYSFADRSPLGVSRDLVLGADQMIANDSVKIINTSYETESGPTNGSSRSALAIDYFASSKDVVWTKSAGNNGANGAGTITIPGDCFNCITVGATAPSPGFSRVANFSSEGRTTDLRNKPDIVAPGAGLSMPTTPNGFSLDSSGTSFAAPHVAGVAALLTQYANDRPRHSDDHKVIKAVLLNSASKDGGEKPGEIHVTRKDGNDWNPTLPGIDALDDQMGAGELNARAAFMQFQPPEATTFFVDANQNFEFSIGKIAWDRNQVSVGHYIEYDINEKLKGGTKLTATLTWDRHVGRTPCSAPCDAAADDIFTAIALSDLNLELYRNDVLLTELDALFRAPFSRSPFDSVEHLYFTLPSDDFYSLRVSNLAGQTEMFAFALWSHAVPEPATILLILPCMAVLWLRQKRKNAAH